MRIKASEKEQNGTCGEGKYCVQIYSRRAALVSEFCLDMQENDVPDMAAAETFLRQNLRPCDFADTTITVIGNDGSREQTILQFGAAND